MVRNSGVVNGIHTQSEGKGNKISPPPSDKKKEKQVKEETGASKIGKVWG